MNMRRLGLAAVFACMVSSAVSQTQGIVYENFDGVSTPFVSNSVGFAAWRTNNSYYVSYPNAYRGEMPLMQGNVVALETPAYDLSIFPNAILRFSHICKIDPRDTVRVEYATEVGAGYFSAWQPIPYTAYQGGGDANQYRQFGFNASFYAAWNAANIAATPTQSWWREELFDISFFAAYNRIKFRFVLKKGATPGTAISYGWLIDNVEVLAGKSPIAVPTVEFVAPLVKDTIYRTGPFEITAKIVSNSSAAIQNPYLKYIAAQNDSITHVDSILMTNAGFGLWKATIPQQTLNASVHYSLKGEDAIGNPTTIYANYFIRTNDLLGDNSASLIAINSPVQQAGLASAPIKISIQNKGVHNLDTLTVYWRLNSNSPNSYVWHGSLPWEYIDANVSIGTYTPTANVYDTLTVWVSNPNNVPNTSSDTVKTVILYGCSGALSGNISVALGGLSAQIDVLRKCGVSGNVNLKLANGIYQENIDLTNLDAVLGNNTLTISSASGNKADVTIQPQSGVGITLGKSNNIIIENITIDAAASGTHAIQMVDECKNIVIIIA